MGRAPCCDKASVKKGPWSAEEDSKLKDYIDKHGTGGNWIALPHKAGLKRCGKSCRLRWLNYLRPNIKHGEFSEDEDRIICSLYASIGSRWSIIAGQLPGRTDNDIKNYWNTKLRKKLLGLLPSMQKKPPFSPSMPLQSSPHSHNHHKSATFLNDSTSFHNYNPNFLNLSSNIHSLLAHNHLNITSLFSPPPLSSNPLIDVNPDNNYYAAFQNQTVKNEYNFCPEMKEGMLIFGGDELSFPSEGVGSCMTQISYNKDHQYGIKQEDQFSLEGFGADGFMIDHDYTDQKTKGCFKTLEEVKQLNDISNSSINVSINSYLMNDGEVENKPTHYY